MIALIDAGRPHCHNQQSQNEDHRRREFRLEAVVVKTMKMETLVVLVEELEGLPRQVLALTQVELVIPLL